MEAIVSEKAKGGNTMHVNSCRSVTGTPKGDKVVYGDSGQASKVGRTA